MTVSFVDAGAGAAAASVVGAWPLASAAAALSAFGTASAFFLPENAPEMPVSFAAALRTDLARDIGGGLDSGVATVRASAGGATASVARSSPDFVIEDSQLLALALVSDEADDVFLPLAAMYC